MTEELAGKHALVTGAGRGIGACIARSLHQDGATVTLLGRTGNNLRQVAETLGLDPAKHCVVADVSDEDQVNAAIATAQSNCGSIDILVNNAGQAGSASFEHTDAKLWSHMVAVNLSGVYHCCRGTLSRMKASGWGRIVNIASTAGLKGYPYVSAYCAAKHGVVGLTRALSLELARTGVTVNAICPGFTDTDLVQDSIKNIAQKTGRSTEDSLASLVASNPQQRLIEPEEVANIVLWLCDSDSRGVTGQSIAVAGGEVM